MIINLEVETRVSALIKAQQLSAEQMWRQIVDQNESTFSGDDSACRSIFVNLQAYIEQTFAELLEEGKIKTAVGIIHTPQPATPLCTDGQITPGLVTDAISQDPVRLATVLKRPKIVRKFLGAGGTLVTTYPEAGRSQRSAEQLVIFDGLRAQYPQHLLDKPLAIDALPRGMSGATYIVEDQQGNKSMFSIMAEQANIQQPSADWGIWFGSINKPKVKERLSTLKPFLSQHDLIFGCMTGIFDEGASTSPRNTLEPKPF
ncbi:MAG: hypothetical protein WC748_05010 [Legionellales bacterium]|jgi:hypothetical protein